MKKMRLVFLLLLSLVLLICVAQPASACRPIRVNAEYDASIIVGQSITIHGIEIIQHQQTCGGTDADLTIVQIIGATTQNTVDAVIKADGTMEITGVAKGNTRIEVKVVCSVNPSDSSQDWADITVLTLPVINTHPANASVTAGQTASFSVTATGDNMIYQWQVDKNDGSGFVNVTAGTGGQDPSYTTEAATMAMNGWKYRVVVTGKGPLSVESNDATLTVNNPSAADITAFSINGVAGVISGTNITVTLPYGTNVTNLTPTIAVSPLASVNPATGVAQDFTAPVAYRVTAHDGSTKDYTVTVKVAAAPSGGSGWIPPNPVSPPPPPAPNPFSAQGEVLRRINVYKYEKLRTALFRLNKGDAFTLLGLANNGKALLIEQNGRQGYIAIKDIMTEFPAAIRATAQKKAAAYVLLDNGKYKRAGYFDSGKALRVHGISGKYLINKQTNETYFLDSTQWRLWVQE